ncbi:glycosyltransferase [Weissella paramesenteroides]|uniref:glycosyltransferase n=1 Tax=Weissella paramesenteroides TaxID=1249 RepID=UPI003F2791D7
MNVVQSIEKQLNEMDLPEEIEYLKHSDEFTVLITTYINDNLGDLKTAIRSVLFNTLVPSEIIVMVDGSIRQETQDVLKRLEVTYPSVLKIIYQKKNYGRGYTLAQGVLNSRNDLIAKMDADDIALPERFEKQFILMKDNEKLSLVGSQIYEFNDKQNFTAHRKVPLDNEEIVKFSKLRSPFNHPTVFFRKKDVLDAGNYSKLNVLEDYDLWMRMIAKKMQVKNIDEDLVYMRAPKNMYSRRGGLKYFITYKNFKKSLVDNKIISYSDYWKSIAAMLISALIPNFFRKKLYEMLLRNK